MEGFMLRLRRAILPHWLSSSSASANIATFGKQASKLLGGRRPHAHLGVVDLVPLAGQRVERGDHPIDRVAHRDHHVLSAPIEHIKAHGVRVDCGVRWSPGVGLLYEVCIRVQRRVDAATARLADVDKKQRRRRRVQAAVAARCISRLPPIQPRFRIVPPTLAQRRRAADVSRPPTLPIAGLLLFRLPIR
eukprot:scaffold55865_cov61-Phaeocystis_antarctica.AAC.7